MLPGVSAEDCLVADLGVDPAAAGLQSYEAGDFLRRRPAIEPPALVLWQIGIVGARTQTANVSAPALPELVELLVGRYPAGHQAVVYEASSYPGVAPIVRDFGSTSSERKRSPSRQRCTCRQFLTERSRPARDDVPLRLEELLRPPRGIPSFLYLAGGSVRLRDREERLGCEHRRVGRAGELHGRTCDFFGLPAAVELGEGFCARDPPRDLRVDVVGRGRLPRSST